jgi:hypothetical protein
VWEGPRMSVLVIFRANGNPDELLSQYDETLSEATAMVCVRGTVSRPLSSAFGASPALQYSSQGPA